MATECGLFGRKGIAKTVETPAQQKHKAVVATRNKVLHDNSKDDLTVFVSNLAYSMHDPEDRIKEIFASFGQIADIRLVYSNRGHFRGYCYVEFKEKEAAINALKLDRQELEGRPMFISPCVDKAKNPEFKVTLLISIYLYNQIKTLYYETCYTLLPLLRTQFCPLP